MSVDEVRTKLLMFKEKYPRDFLLIRSEHDVDKVNLENSEMSDLLDFEDPRIIKLVESALNSGRQAAVQGAGRDRVLVHTAKRGTKLLR